MKTSAKRQLDQLPAGEADLISGRKAPPKKPVLKLTGPANMPKRPLSAKAAIRETVKQVRAKHERDHERRVASCTKAAEQAPTPEVAALTNLGRLAPAVPAATEAPKEKLIEAAARKLRAKLTERAAGVELTRQPGTGWHRLSIDGKDIGPVFKTTQKGKVMWRAQEGMERIKGDDHRRFAFGSTPDEAASALAGQLAS